MKKKFLFINLFLFLIVLIGSCTKAGTGGNATVICKVNNTDNGGGPVNGATVYVSYGRSTPPSANNTGYDDHKTAAANSNLVTFTGLKEGTYYFYAEGVITSGGASATISGGAPFSLTHGNRNGTSNATINIGY